MNSLEKNTENSRNIDLIKKTAWVKLLQELPNDLSKISFSFEEINEKVQVSFESFLSKFDFIDKEKFSLLKVENVWENSLLEIYKTYNFLINKFNESKNKLNDIWFSLDVLLYEIIKRLCYQVIEAWEGTRKLKNWNVVWLLKYNTNHFIFNKTPYYAFASTNVSLDFIKILNKKDSKIYSLREIDDLLNSKDDTGWLFLPNSLGVSINLITTDSDNNNIFISQERNNSSTLSQNSAKYIASASWAVDYNLFTNEWKLTTITEAIHSEIIEELWIDSINSKINKETLISKTKKNTDSILNNDLNYRKIQILSNLLKEEWYEILWRELWLEANILPWALVMEEKRRNPEFTFLWKIWYNLDEIKKSWENASSKEESLSIKWITFDEIKKELDNREKWLEKTIDDHFFMSYLWYLIKLEEI